MLWPKASPLDLDFGLCARAKLFKIEFSNLNLGSDILNCELSLSEVSAAVDRTKCGKAYLDIPNDVMKNYNAKVLLHRFLNLCFTAGVNPSDWYYSNIIPIPKPDKDPRDPLQNRCITILCCVGNFPGFY